MPRNATLVWEGLQVLGLAAVLVFATATCRASPADGERVFEILSAQGLLEDYMPEAMNDIVDSLVTAAGRWDGFGINRPYRAGAVNVYLIDSRRLPASNPLQGLGVVLTQRDLSGNALAHEPTGILFVDTVLLKSLVTAALIVSDTDSSIMSVVAALNARGIDAYRDLWDPTRNPRLTTAGYADDWVIYASGAAAFVLAHEMGHLALGAQDVDMRRRPMRFDTPADRDLHWACPELIQEKFAHQQQIERAADEFAVDVLSRVNFPPGVLNMTMLRYELGARWYTIYGASEQMVRSLDATESEVIRASLRNEFGADVFDVLAARKVEPGDGSIQVFFPETHPAHVQRAARSLGRLARSPNSIYFGTQPGVESAVLLLDQLLAAECTAVKARLEVR